MQSIKHEKSRSINFVLNIYELHKKFKKGERERERMEKIEATHKL
jgi:hypothetical protein